MDPVLLYVKLEPYVAQWFINEMGGEPVHLPKRSAESDIIEYFLKPTPNNAVANLPTDGCISIQIPTYKHKDAKYFNYLPPRAMDALERCITVRFRVQLWQDLHKLHKPDCGCLTDLIYAWMENHGIECTEQNWEAIRQFYFRKRKIYLKKSKKDSEITE